jgi:hypothetical protein
VFSGSDLSSYGRSLPGAIVEEDLSMEAQSELTPEE